MRPDKAGFSGRSARWWECWSPTFSFSFLFNAIVKGFTSSFLSLSFSSNFSFFYSSVHSPFSPALILQFSCIYHVSIFSTVCPANSKSTVSNISFMSMFFEFNLTHFPTATNFWMSVRRSIASSKFIVDVSTALRSTQSWPTAIFPASSVGIYSTLRSTHQSLLRCPGLEFWRQYRENWIASAPGSNLIRRSANSNAFSTVKSAFSIKLKPYRFLTKWRTSSAEETVIAIQ